MLSRKEATEKILAAKQEKNLTFEQIAESHVFVFRESFEDFEQAFFDADAGLDTLDEELVGHAEIVPWYIGTLQEIFPHRLNDEKRISSLWHSGEFVSAVGE